MNNERMTDPKITKALGLFDLDPCCSKKQNYYHANKNLFVEEHNGLFENWNGRVWLNPPFSTPKPWLDRMASHRNGIALVLASVNSTWIHDYCFTKANAVLFPRKRIQFYNIDGTEIINPKTGKKSSNDRDVCFFAYGWQNAIALKQAQSKNSIFEGKFIPLY